MLIRFQWSSFHWVSQPDRISSGNFLLLSSTASFFLSFFLPFFPSFSLSFFLPSFLIFTLFLARCTFERQKVDNTQDLTERPGHTGLCKVDLKGNKPSVPIRSSPTRQAWSAPPVNHGKQKQHKSTPTKKHQVIPFLASESWSQVHPFPETATGGGEIWLVNSKALDIVLWNFHCVLK